MSGKLYMLTPVASPMVTRPTSPSSEDATRAAATAVFQDTSVTSTYNSFKSSNTLARLSSVSNSSSSTSSTSIATAAESLIPPEAMAAASSGSPPRAPAGTCSDSSPPCPQQQLVRWRSPPCCSSCGAAKADRGSCSGCGGRFCKACMLPDNSSSRSTGLLGSAIVAKAGRSGLGGACSNCSSLCNACKPITCSFCEPSSGLAAAARMCEACAGTCDSCKRAACDPCAASFAACASCGYATCEDCRLQMHISSGGVMGPAAAGNGGLGSGCWCAPPLRAASNVRHISSQRYQLSQLHPSVLASSMQAAGLRDAEEDYDEEFNDYDDLAFEYEYNPAASGSDINATAALASAALGGCGGLGEQPRPGLHQLLDADVLSAHHRHWASAGSGSGRLSGFLQSAVGSLGGSYTGAHGLASPGSSHSSASHMLHGSYRSSFAAAGATSAAGSSGSPCKYQQQQQRGGSGGFGAAAVVAAAAAGAGVGMQFGVKCV